MRASQGLRFFDSLFLAGKGLLAFQGLRSAAVALLNCRLSTRQGGPAGKAHVGRAARLSQRQGMVSAFAASDKAGKPAWKRDMVRTVILLAHPMKG